MQDVKGAASVMYWDGRPRGQQMQAAEQSAPVSEPWDERIGVYADTACNFQYLKAAIEKTV